MNNEIFSNKLDLDLKEIIKDLKTRAITNVNTIIIMLQAYWNIDRRTKREFKGRIWIKIFKNNI